ncbi:hypothetical protein ABW20_dc0108156 [Dactylellina cionopaga]|nr:hypothetical protein ABW20_dc0108156 [Dactylellina cionopaga]
MSSQKAFQAALSSAADFLQPVFKPQNVPKKSPDALYAPRDQRIILGLADLILLEGIYPNVTPGILLPLDRRTKSSGYFSQVQAAASSQDGSRRDVALLGAIVDTVGPILAASSNEVSDAVRERLQMDFIACVGELGFHPDTGSADWQSRFFVTLDSTTPPWFQKVLTTYLSTIPLKRPNGVKDEISFFIDTKTDVSTQRAALQQASKLISSVPSSSTPEQYFSIIAPQLLVLLDEPGNLSTAAAIVTNGIMDRRRQGIEKYFFPALRKPLHPSQWQIPRPEEVEPGDIVTLVSEEDLNRALQRLALLFRSSDGKGYPITRVLDPLISVLWGLWQYALSIKASDTTYTKLPQQLLATYLKLRGGAPTLNDVVQAFKYNGEKLWKFSRGEMGQVKIIMKDKSMESAQLQISDIENQVPRFIDLALEVNDDVFTDFFLGLCRRWLGGTAVTTTSRFETGAEEAFSLLFQLKVLEGILEHHSERLTRRPEQVIILVKEILDEHVRKLKNEKERLNLLQQPSIDSLGMIVGNENDSAIPEDGDDVAGVEAVNIALQLLNSIVSTSFSRTVSEKEKKLLSTVQLSLKYLSSSSGIPSSISSLTRSLSLFISTQDIPFTVGPADGESAPVDEKVLKQQQTLQTALLYLRDDMVPIRAHGLELLKELISGRSSVIDVPAITKLLIDMLQDKESFVYLGVIKTLCELSDKHPSTVIKMLVELYVDEKENMGINERLAVGEALTGTVQRLGETAVGKVAEEVGNTMIGLAGRRKRRYREAKEVKREKEEERKRIKSEGEMDAEYAKVLKEARVEAGIDGVNGVEVKIEEVEDDERWISTVGEEDYRIRMSALSVLGVLFETNAAGVPSGITAAAIEVSLNILNLEKEKEQAAVRRAAVHLISSILNGLEKGGTMELLKVVPRERLEDIVRILGYVRATDDDGLVREQAGILLEILTE